MTTRDTIRAAKATLYAILTSIAKKNEERDLLDPGSVPVNLSIVGRVADQDINEQFDGSLLVNHPQTVSSSSACDQSHLLAHVLSKLPKRVRSKLFDDLPAQFAELGGLPEVDTSLKLQDEIAAKLGKRDGGRGIASRSPR
jgi:hypothetical protein